MTRVFLLCTVLTCSMIPSRSFAQPPSLDDSSPFSETSKFALPTAFAKRADVKFEVVPAAAKWGETVTVRLTITPKNGARTYPFHRKDPKQVTGANLVLPPPGDLIFLGEPTDPPPEEKPREENKPDGPKDEYYSKPVTWEMKAVVSPRATGGLKTLRFGQGTVLEACDNSCTTLRGEELPTAEFKVEATASNRVHPEDLSAAMKLMGVVATSGTVTKAGSPSSSESAGTQRKTAKPIAEYTAALDRVAASLSSGPIDAPAVRDVKTGLGAFLTTAALWGLISLVTPCVFPMIPITVSIFLKQAHGSMAERLKLAGVYCLTIILVLGTSAFALLKFMAALAIDPITNVLLGLLFLVLALSLFGMFELTLPNFMVSRLQSKQAKGGMVGTIFGALAFTIISFTCVAPFLGGFAGISAADSGSSLIALPTTRELLGGLVFATAFAAPFFVLALVPGLLKALPRSGGWLDSVKVVMGFLELAAALKFLRTAELQLISPTQYFTFDLVLGGWVVICFACGLYLLNLYRLPHDEEQPHISVPRLLLAITILGLGVYLTPALFRGSDGQPQRPTGAVYAWVDAFLLPETQAAGTDLPEAIDRARQNGKLVFVDFTGETCSNCKLNKADIFPLSAVSQSFKQFERVEMYTDWIPSNAYLSDPGVAARTAEAEANKSFQKAVFKDIQLPLYAILQPTPDGKVKLIGVYNEGKINDASRFAAFLNSAIDKTKK